MSEDGRDKSEMVGGLSNEEWRQLVADVKYIRTGMANWQDSLRNVESQLADLKENMDTRLTHMEQTMTNTIQTLVSDEVQKVSEGLQSNIDLVDSKVNAVVTQLDQISTETNSNHDDNADERTVVVRGMVCDDEVLNVADQVKDMFVNVLGVDCTIIEAEKLRAREGTIPSIKVVLATVNDRVSVLQNKTKCKDTDKTKRVFIDRLKSKVELTAEHNTRMILKRLAPANMRITGSGRLVHVSDNKKTLGGVDKNQSSPAAAPLSQVDADGVVTAVAPHGSVQAQATTESSSGGATHHPTPHITGGGVAPASQANAGGRAPPSSPPTSQIGAAAAANGLTVENGPFSPTTVTYVNEFPDPKSASVVGNKKPKNQQQQQHPRSTRSTSQTNIQNNGETLASSQPSGSVTSQGGGNGVGRGGKPPKHK